LPGNRLEPYRAGMIPTIFTPVLLAAAGCDCTKETTPFQGAKPTVFESFPVEIEVFCLQKPLFSLQNRHCCLQNAIFRLQNALCTMQRGGCRQFFFLRAKVWGIM